MPKPNPKPYAKYPPRDLEGGMIPSIDSILNAVHDATGVHPRNERRNRSGVLSRRTAVYCLRVMRNMSYPEIAEALGIAHSSAIDSYTKAEADPGVMAAANHVRRKIDAAA